MVPQRPPPQLYYDAMSGGGVPGAQAVLGGASDGSELMLPLFSSPTYPLGTPELTPAAGYPVTSMPTFFQQQQALHIMPTQLAPQVGPGPLGPGAGAVPDAAAGMGASAGSNAANIRAQRTSARQAAKAKQAAALQVSGSKRKTPSRSAAAAAAAAARAAASESDEGTDSDSDEDDNDDDATVPQRPNAARAASLLPPQPKPHDIAKTKYNHIEDEKERKRLKRLLRNRVSAQQARERKKAYLGSLESHTKDMENKVAQLEQKVAQLERENFMLRQVVKTSTMKNADQLENQQVPEQRR